MVSRLRGNDGGEWRGISPHRHPGQAAARALGMSQRLSAARSGIQSLAVFGVSRQLWIPAFAGMTDRVMPYIPFVIPAKACPREGGEREPIRVVQGAKD